MMENWQEIGQAVQTAIKTKDMAIDGGAVVTGFTVFGLSGNEWIAVIGALAAALIAGLRIIKGALDVMISLAELRRARAGKEGNET